MTTGSSRPRLRKNKNRPRCKSICRIQSRKSRRFETRLGFLAGFAQFSEVPGVFTQPRPLPGTGRSEIVAVKQSFAACGKLDREQR
jgi:hypothetical protein